MKLNHVETSTDCSECLTFPSMLGNHINILIYSCLLPMQYYSLLHSLKSLFHVTAADPSKTVPIPTTYFHS